MIGSVDMIAFENWSKLPKYNTLFENFVSILMKLNKKMKIFVDLADPSIKSKE